MDGSSFNCKKHSPELRLPKFKCTEFVCFIEGKGELLCKTDVFSYQTFEPKKWFYYNKPADDFLTLNHQPVGHPNRH